MLNRIFLTTLALTGAGLLAGCDATDPLLRDGQWHAEHINRANLTLMAANPVDLVRGTGETTTDGILAAAAVDRLYTNKVKKLPDAGLSPVAVTGQGGQ
jgi:hypothetical protein